MTVVERLGPDDQEGRSSIPRELCVSDIERMSAKSASSKCGPISPVQRRLSEDYVPLPAELAQALERSRFQELSRDGARCPSLEDTYVNFKR